MIKSKWYELSVKKNLRTLALSLQSREFVRGAEVGVELTHASASAIDARFIEEVVDVELIMDPFGIEIRTEVKRFLIFNFSIRRSVKANVYLIRVMSPPRSLRSFINFLTECFGFGLAVAPVVVNVRAFVEALTGSSEFHLVRVRKIRIGRIRLSDKSVARMDVASSADAIRDVVDLVDLNSAHLEQVALEFYGPEGVGIVEVTAGGGLASTESAIQLITPFFIQCFEFHDSDAIEF